MSGLPFELLLALRYLRPKRTFVSVITLISVAGVALGVAVLIVVISVMSGFDKQLRDTILGFNAHIKVFVPRGGKMADYPKVMAIVASNKDVKGVAPYVMGQALFETTTNDHAQQPYDVPHRGFAGSIRKPRGASASCHQRLSKGNSTCVDIVYWLGRYLPKTWGLKSATP